MGDALRAALPPFGPSPFHVSALPRGCRYRKEVAMSEGSDDMSMVFAFDDQSESFVHGFELGQLWQAIDGEGQLEVDRGFDGGFPIHTANVETLRRMCVVRGYTLETKTTDLAEWTSARLRYVGTGNTKPRLSLVT